MKPAFLPRSIVLALFASLSLPLACGDSEDSQPGPDVSSAGAAGDGPGSAGPGDGGADSASAGQGTTAAGQGGSVSQGGEANFGGAGAGTGLVPGISDTPETIECAAQSCESAFIASVQLYVPPCCAAPNGSVCGLDTSILAGVGRALDPVCQARAQPGVLDSACPVSEARPVTVPTPIGNQSLPISFPGCCRGETGTCGYQVDTIKAAGFTLGTVGLGCVDAAPWLDGAVAPPCGAGREAGGGAGGQGD